MIEEGQEKSGVQISECDARRSFPDVPFGKMKQEPKSVSVGRDRTWTNRPLAWKGLES